MVSNYTLWISDLSGNDRKQKEVTGSISDLLFDAWSDNFVGKIVILKRKRIFDQIRSEILVSMDILNFKIKITCYASQKERKEVFKFLCNVCEEHVDFFISCEHSIV